MKRSYALIATVVVLALLSSTSEAIAQGSPPFQPSPAQVEASTSTALGTAFTYQGRLVQGSNPVNGTCDFQFSLWDSLSNPTGQIGATAPKTGVLVTNGLFTAALDFGASAFTGAARWLQIAVKCGSDSGYTTLAPRQELTPAPYALALPGLYTQQNATSPNIVGGYSGNSVTDGVYGATLSGGGSGGWANRVTDNHGVVGGGFGNQAGDNAGTTNDKEYATVGGGGNNTASNTGATIGGGGHNTAGGEVATIAGGYYNTANGAGSFIGGGGHDGTNTLGNTASGNLAVVSGGAGNIASGYGSVVGGGGGWSGSTVVSNTASANWATVGGGTQNVASGAGSTIPGGNGNLAQGTNSFAAGTQAHALHTGAFVWGDGQYVDFSSTANNQFLIRATGGVGINTTSTTANNLTVNGQIIGGGTGLPGGALEPFVARGNNAGISLDDRAGGANARWVVYPNLGSLQFWNGANRVTINSSGNVGIGATSPDQKLVVNAGALTRLAVDSNANGNAGVSLRQNGTSRWSVATAGTDGDFQIFEDDTGYNRIFIKGAGANQGYVGIGTNTPAAMLDVAGTMASNVVQIRGGSDLAERFDVDSRDQIEPGTLMIIDDQHPGKLRPSDQAYDTKVAGIVSGAGGVQPGLTLQQEGVMEGNTAVAIAGRVYVKAEAFSAPIKPGDLLTSSNIPGYAMKATDHDRAQGAIIGKAMSELDEGTGLVLVLVNLQ